MVTLLAAPRPEITLNAWSVQVSAPKQEIVVETANKVRSVVYRYNQQLQEALERGWEYLTPLLRDQVNFAKYFAPYVLERYEHRGTGPGCANGAYWHCLGYKGAFSESMQPPLTNMIGILASFADAKPNAFVDSLEAGQCQCNTLGGPQLKVSAQAPQPPPASCEELDERYYRSPMKRGPHFACFREQLKSSLKPRSSQLARLRIRHGRFPVPIQVLDRISPRLRLLRLRRQRAASPR